LIFNTKQIILFAIFLQSFFLATAQTDTSLIHQKDVLDIIHSVFVKKQNREQQNIKRADKKIQFSVMPGIGYTLQSQGVAIVTSNLAFYLGKKDSTSLSVITPGIAITQLQQLLIPLQSIIWTKNNTYNFIGDYRYYKYPQVTYGLGSFSQQADGFTLDASFFRLYQYALRKVNNNFYMGIGYMLDYRWGIKKQLPDSVINTDFDKYNNASKTVSSGVTLNLIYDTRHNAINPNKGLYINATYRMNNTSLGSTSNSNILLVDIRKYLRPNKNSKNVLALWQYSWLTTSGKPPYLDLPTTSWDPYNNMGRGYIQSRFRGLGLLYAEAEYRFNISKNNFWGGAIFANAQSVSEYPSKKFERILPGIGAGIRIKVNKLSKTNLCLDYAFGINGSQGIFVNLGEVF
jgi:Omp85 superfamily domain